MNITFLIGNGFDLKLGLKTRYTDFYPYFLERASKNNIIKDWISEDTSLWSDMERELGRQIIKVSEKTLEKFFDDKDELNLLLGDYLTEQESKIDDEYIKSSRNEFVRSLKGYVNDLPDTQRNSINGINKAFTNEDFEYHFIVFNYTLIIDRLVSINNNVIANHVAQNGVQKNELIRGVLHIHGTTEEDMIIGVNDMGQIENEAIKANVNLQNAMIKGYMNEGIAKNKINYAKNIINNSRIIYIYGMSLGDTDNMWWDYIIDWLAGNDHNRLIYYVFTDDPILIQKSPGRRIIKTDKIISDFLGKKQLSDDVIEKIKTRIFIIYNASIFGFKSVETLTNDVY